MTSSHIREVTQAIRLPSERPVRTTRKPRNAEISGGVKEDLAYRETSEPSRATKW